MRVTDNVLSKPASIASYPAWGHNLLQQPKVVVSHANSPDTNALRLRSMAIERQYRFQSSILNSPSRSVHGPVWKQSDQYIKAQSELERVKAVAIEEGYPKPTDELVREASQVLEWMFQRYLFTYEVTPEDDGGIAIHAIHNKVYVCVILSQEGPDQCFVDMDGEHRRSTYSDRRKLCGTFLLGALQDLRAYGR